MHSRTSLAQDLRALGIGPGDLIFVHSSFKSLGPVEGGASTVVGAMEGATGADGMIVMPSFNLIGDRDERAARWNVGETPSSVGWLTESFRRMPGTYRSDHYSHSTAARGKGAESFVGEHLSDEGPATPWDREPWGRTHGRKAPMLKAYRRDGHLLMLGVDYETSTFCHVVEALYWERKLEEDPTAEFVSLHRGNLGEFWERLGRVRRGCVGDSDSRCFGIRDYVDTLLTEVERNPDHYDRLKLEAKNTTKGETNG